jgi:hypothetical protein
MFKKSLVRVLIPLVMVGAVIGAAGMDSASAAGRPPQEVKNRLNVVTTQKVQTSSYSGGKMQTTWGPGGPAANAR